MKVSTQLLPLLLLHPGQIIIYSDFLLPESFGILQGFLHTEAHQVSTSPTASTPGTDNNCHAAAVQNSPSAGLHCCIYTYADCLLLQGASSQHQPTATMPETDYICCASVDCTAAFTPMPFTQRRVESAPAHSKHAWDRLYLLCRAAAVQNSLTAGLNCSVYIYADCLLLQGASSQHQPTATMPETDYICCASVDCTAAFTPMPFTQRRVESAPAHSKHA